MSIKRYDAYFGCNTSIEQIARECDDGAWVKFEDVKNALGLFAKEDVEKAVDETLKGGVK